MLIKTNLLVGEINYLIQSDVEFPYLNENKFELFKSRLTDSNVKIEFKEIKQFDKNVFSDKQNINQIKKSILFKKSWIEHPFFYSSQFREVFNNSSKNPDYLKIELAWNRILFFDFLFNNFLYLYPPESRNIFVGAEYQARLRNLAGYGLPGLQGMLVHGAGLNINNRGALFLAPDNGGKTSTVTLYKNDCILSDDQIVLRFKTNKTDMYGTPFGTISSGNEGIELKGIFLIKKAQSFKLTKAKSSEVVKFIWDEHFFTICFLPKEYKKRLFCALADSIKMIPSYYLYLAKGFIDSEKIEESLSG